MRPETIFQARARELYDWLHENFINPESNELLFDKYQQFKDEGATTKVAFFEMFMAYWHRHLKATSSNITSRDDSGFDSCSVRFDD